MAKSDPVKVRIAVMTAVLAGIAAPARGEDAEVDAADDGEDRAGALGDVEIHAFVSQGYLKSTGNNYLAESTGTGSFELTEVGVNVSRQLSDRLRVGLQLFARDLGPIGDYTARLDWGFLDYRWRDWLGARAGRIKLPFGLYNDVSDIDAAHPGVFMPQSVYPAQNRDFLLAQTGAEIYGYRDFDRAGALDYRLYGGTIFLDLDASAGASPYDVVRLAIPYVVGGRVLWELPNTGLRLGGSVQALRLESTLQPRPTAMTPMPAPITLDLDAVLWIASADYVVDDFQFVVEYSRWHTEATTSDPMFPPTATVSERAYGLATYRPRPWLQPGLYYAWYRPDIDDGAGAGARHHDAALLLRFDLSSHWIAKVEGHYMRGTAGLSPALNGGTQPDDLDNTWTLFAAKVTAYF
jgi:hypothetical protein